MLGWSRPWGSLGLSERGTDLVQLIGAGWLSPLVTFSRAQAGGAVSSALAADGAQQYYAADTPRFNGAARRLLIEQQFTTGVRNPRAQGAVPGTPGTAPSFWSIQSSGGVTRQILGTGTEDQIPYVDFRLSAGSNIWSFHGLDTGNVAITGSTPTVRSVYVRLLAGTLPTDILQLSGDFFDGGGNNLTGGAFQPINPTGAPLRNQRFVWPSLSPASAASFSVSFRLLPNSPFDVTLRMGLPQAGAGAVATSPVLPAEGSPAASTRGADNARVTGSAFASLFAAGAGTILMSGALRQLAPGGQEQVLFDISDGTANNRFTVVNAAGGNQVLLARALGGAGFTTVAGAATPGAGFRVGLTLDGSGAGRASWNGGAEVSVFGGPTSGLAHLQFGALATLAGILNGEIGTVQRLPPVPPGQLAPLVASFG